MLSVLFSVLGWTLVTLWLLMLAGAATLAWRYYTREDPARRAAPKFEMKRVSDQQGSLTRPPVVIPRPR